MRLPYVAILFLSCISSALGDNVRQLVNEWYASSYRVVNDELALSKLARSIIRDVPNAQDRLNGLYEIVATESDPDKQVSFFSALAVLIVTASGLVWFLVKSQK